jgi:hypothetical protein
MKLIGTLVTSFQMLGSIHISVELDGLGPGSKEVNDLLRTLKDKRVQVTIEGQP